MLVFCGPIVKGCSIGDSGIMTITRGAMEERDPRFLPGKYHHGGSLEGYFSHKNVCQLNRSVCVRTWLSNLAFKNYIDIDIISNKFLE